MIGNSDNRNQEKLSLILKNIELLVQLMKMELNEKSNIISLTDLFGENAAANINYDPDYFEEE